MTEPYVLIAVGIMSAVTYLPRMLPLTLFRKRIRSRFVRSFLSYVPFAVLAAMTLPDILSSTACLWSALAGMAVAVILSWFGRGLLTVALGAAGAVFLSEWILRLCGVM